MELVDFDTQIPEENVALDEMLLMKAEKGAIGETIRFWESQEYFIVVGRSGKVKEDCYFEKCSSDGVKIIRRISGGGTVIQGRGCFNYSAVLSYDRENEYRSISGSYSNILKAISKDLRSKGFDVDFFCISDLAHHGKKISGNAQARKRNYFLQHGTFLYDFDLDKISFYLKHPSMEPEYRQGRLHPEFVTNINIKRGDIERSIKDFFSPEGIWEPEADDILGLNSLVDNKYKNPEWNHAF